MVDCENGECDNARKMQHEITEKDTYYGLANRTYQGQFTVDDLRKWNPGIDENNLQIGQKINIIDSEQIKKDAIVRWIAQEIAIPGMVKADDPVVLNVISSNIDFSKFVWNDIKINSDNKLEGIGVLDHIVTPIVEKELKKRVARAFVKKGATTLTVRTASKLVAGTVGVTAGVIFNLLDPSTFGAQSFNEEDRSKRAYDALDLYIKVKSKEN